MSQSPVPSSAPYASPLSVNPVSGVLELSAAPSVPVRVVRDGVPFAAIALAVLLGFALWRAA